MKFSRQGHYTSWKRQRLSLVLLGLGGLLLIVGSQSVLPDSRSVSAAPTIISSNNFAAWKYNSTTGAPVTHTSADVLVVQFDPNVAGYEVGGRAGYCLSSSAGHTMSSITFNASWLANGYNHLFLSVNGMTNQVWSKSGVTTGSHRSFTVNLSGATSVCFGNSVDPGTTTYPAARYLTLFSYSITGASLAPPPTGTPTSQPTITPKPTVTPTPTSTSTPTATATPTATPPLSGSSCLRLQSDGVHPIYADLDACGYPSPDTAGVPSGTALKTVSSGCGCLPANTVWTGSELSIDGPTTIDDLYIPGNIYFATSNFPQNGASPAKADVTIENSKIQDASATTLVDLQGAGHVTIKDSQISGTYTGSACTGPVAYDVADGGTNNILDHDSFTCSGEPVNGGGFTLTHSYVLVDGYPAGEHLEAFYIPGGGTADIEDNTLLQPNNQTAGIFGDGKLGALNDVTVKSNLIGEGGNNGNVAIGCYASYAQNGYKAGPNNGLGYSTNVVVENNRMSTVYDTAQWPFAAGNTDGGSGTTWSGNYMDDDPSTVVSQPVSPC